MKLLDSLILFRSFFSIALLTLGGGPAMLPVMEREFVEKRHWITAEKMLDFITITQSLPGVIAFKMAILVGRERAGILGAFFALLGTLIPSLIIILILSGFLQKMNDRPEMAAILAGIRAGVTGLMAALLYRMGCKSISGKAELVIAIGAFGIISFSTTSPVLVIIVVFGAGIFKDRFLSSKKGEEKWDQ